MRCRLNCGATGKEDAGSFVVTKPHTCVPDRVAVEAECMKNRMKIEAKETGQVEPSFRRVEAMEE